MSDHHGRELPTGRNLLVSTLMNLIITLSEVVGGLVSGSLALLADASITRRIPWPASWRCGPCGWSARSR